ncbi:MAG TPA: glycosyltransferase family 4 protein [Acidobacteriota bacterium]|jgi:glycosyltransferase involved in cell wall biosynthesis
MKVSIFATHPIQYHVPWFRGLASRKEIRLKVHYALLPNSEQQGVGFGVPFDWDIPMLQGYQWEVLSNGAAAPSLKGFFKSRVHGAARVLANEKPDVAILTGWNAFPLLQVLWAAVAMKIPVVVRGESNVMRPRPTWVHLAHRSLLSFYNGFLAIGKSNRAFYLLNGVAPERIFHCPYFVENDRFVRQLKRLNGDRDVLRSHWGIREDSTCFLFAGKLERKKRLMDLIEAVNRARASNPKIFLLVVGTGELMHEAQRKVQECRLPAAFAGFLNQTEITQAYCAADCLVLPSDYGETWGLVVNEAMACGLPALVSDRVGCGPDLVEENVTGAVFPCGDIAALAEMLVKLASDRAILPQMGQQARLKVNSYSVENAVEGTLNAIRSVAGYS